MEKQMRASGPFDVKLVPQPPTPPNEATTLGRLLIDKEFHGELEATSKGEMLAASSTSEKGSAGYVAIERVTGRLHGREGSFHLQHSGSVNRGAQSLSITVIPDTGTGELTGISGSMKIDIAEGKHAYTFNYTLAE
jgi:hypothetical protein